MNVAKLVSECSMSPWERAGAEARGRLPALVIVPYLPPATPLRAPAWSYFWPGGSPVVYCCRLLGTRHSRTKWAAILSPWAPVSSGVGYASFWTKPHQRCSSLGSNRLRR